jgi:hypothetical protein
MIKETSDKDFDLRAANDNQPPKVKETNKFFGWLLLVGLLIIGIYLSFY